MLYPIRFQRGDLAVNLFTTIATLGSPIDVTLQELRVEMFFPADEPSKRCSKSGGADGGAWAGLARIGIRALTPIRHRR